MILKKINNKIIIITIVYATALMGFLLNENSSGGSLKDFNYTYQFILKISENLNNGVHSMLQENQYHFPLHYIIIGFLLKLFDQIWIVRLIFFHICLLIPLIFYKCLKSQYKNKDSIFFFSILIFFSPYFRSSSIWATTDNTALFFFLSSTYFFFQYYQTDKFNIFLYSIIFLFLAFYSRQYYILFIFYLLFLYVCKKKLTLKKYLITFITILLCSIPALLYIFQYYLSNVSNVTGYYSKNFLNNFYIMLSIIFFYLVPFLIFSKKNILLFFNYFKNKFWVFILISSLILLFSKDFTYGQNPHGGGIVYKFFYLHINHYFFFVICSLSLMTIFFFFKEKLINNLSIFTIILLCFYFNTIFQKYFDPLLIILFSIFFKSSLIKNEIEHFKNNYWKYYSYFFIFYLISFTYH